MPPGARPAPLAGPTNGPKPPPQTAQTQAVVDQGRSAIDARRQAASYDQTGQGQALRDTWQQMQQSGTGYSSHPSPTSPYAQWQQAQGFGAPSSGPISYGQTFPKSDYNGYKTEADMWNAAEGSADMRRQAQVQQADAMKLAMQQQLAALDSQYGQQGAQPTGASIAALAHFGGAQAREGAQAHSFGGITGLGGHNQPMMLQNQTDVAQRLAQAQQHNTGDYMGKLNDWYAQQAEPRVTGMETANQINNTPLYDYQRQAAGQMGIDPALAAGHFPQSGQVLDAANQRNIESLNATGLPYAEQQSTINQYGNQQAADQKQATAADQAQMIDDIYGATTIPGDQLASAANAPLDAVHQIVTDPMYQSYVDTIANNAKLAEKNNPITGDPASDKLAQAAIQKAVDDAIAAAVDDVSTKDPNTARVLGRILSAQNWV